MTCCMLMPKAEQNPSLVAKTRNGSPSLTFFKALRQGQSLASNFGWSLFFPPLPFLCRLAGVVVRELIAKEILGLL